MQPHRPGPMARQRIRGPGVKPDVVTVAVTRVDGGLTVVRVITTEYGVDGPHWTVKPTTLYIQSVLDKYGWTGDEAIVSWRVVPNDFVNEQTDRTFRNAWKDGEAKPAVDMPKAREIQRDRLREIRIPLLDALDIAYQRADETGDVNEKIRIVREKQRLRDLPADPRIEAAQTPEDLKEIG